MSDTTFLNLVRGNRVTNYLGLHEDQVKFGPDYTYVELPAMHFLHADGEKADVAVRNQHLQLVVAAFQPHRLYKLLVVTNPELQRVATIPAMYLVDGANEEVGVEIWATFRKDFKLADLPWAVRLYLMS